MAMKCPAPTPPPPATTTTSPTTAQPRKSTSHEAKKTALHVTADMMKMIMQPLSGAASSNKPGKPSTIHDYIHEEVYSHHEGHGAHGRQCDTSRGAIPKWGISRSQDDERHKRGHSVETEQPLRYCSVSPAHQHATLGGAPSTSTRTPTNVRLKFRKSHTCGSLFAKCNCSEIITTADVPVLPPLPVIQAAAEAAALAMGRSRDVGAATVAWQRERVSIGNGASAHNRSPSSGADAQALRQRSSAAPATTTTTTATATTSASSTSGFHSLSAQTSSATTASTQLSRDDDDDVGGEFGASFDYLQASPAGSGVVAHAFEANWPGDGTAAASLSAAKLANGTYATNSSTTTTTTTTNFANFAQFNATQLQVPRILPPLPATPLASPISESPQTVPSVAAHQPTTAQPFQTPPTGSTAVAVSSPRRSSRTGDRPQPPRRLFQSYSHPDTDFIFTDENKRPAAIKDTPRHEPRTSHCGIDAVIITADGRVEIRQPRKRSSSPNIGNFQVLDVAVHPDILVKISPKHSPVSERRQRLSQVNSAPQPHCAAIQSQSSASLSPTPSTSPGAQPNSAQQRRRLLQRSHEIASGGSGGSTSDDSFDLKGSPDPARRPLLPVKRSPKGAPPTSANGKTLAGSTSTDTATHTTTTTHSFPVRDEAYYTAAEKYFAESGILGSYNAASNLFRKTSKVLQDPSGVLEQARKTSISLRANNRRTSAQSSPPGTPTSSNTTTRNTGTPATRGVEQAALSSTLTQPGHVPLRCPSAAIKTAMETPMKAFYNNNTSMMPQSPHTMTSAGCGYNGTPAQDDRDAQIKSLQGEIVCLQDVIKSRDAEIVKLRREIHKLKSVLQQTTNPLPIGNDELLQSPTTQRCFMSPLTPPSPIGTVDALQSAEVSSSQATSRCLCCQRHYELQQNQRLSSAGGVRTPPSATNGSIDTALSESYYATNYGPTLATSNGTITASCALADVSNANGAAEAQPTTITTPTQTCLNAMSVVPTTAADSSAASNGNAVKAEAAIVTTSAATTTNGSAGGGGDGSGSKMPKLCQLAPVLKKQGVSGESCETITLQQSISVPIPKFDKDFSSKQLIKEAIMDNDFLKNIDASQVRELVDSMYPLAVAKGEFVIREGEAGSHLYVSHEGDFEVMKNGQVLGVMGPGKAFGELAILYNCTRTASIRVLSAARVWVLDRRVFQQIMMRTGMQRIENSVNFLRSVPLLKNLSHEVLAKIADVLEVEFYPAGTYIIRQGASGDTFFIISQGSVRVTQRMTSEEKEIRTLQCGDYFGEQALINEDKRTANIIALEPGVECLTLDRDSFTHLIGDLCELKEKNYGDANRALAMKFSEKTKEIFGANVQQEFPEMQLTDLEVIATLGIGGFGRVELVKAYRQDSVDIFALKCLKKRHIVDTKQEEHVFSERTIMLTCNTPFICRLHRTFRDEKYVYMLLEACMGGEIWTMLRDRGSFDENATQFIIGCVLQAFEYLHSRGIIYRDLKPENLMLDERGYVKLVDFGFAKHIGNSSKTWTFCGTPEYVAPEIILNKGHDRAVDYWALGVLIHELLNGTPPFTSNDPMRTYNIILKGIDMIAFPKHMSRSAVQLIKRLCRDVPAERLGYQKGGIQDIKKHKWFLGFDWDGLASQLLIPPFVRPIAHPTDTAYFDRFPCDENEPPDELSGWDADF